VPKITPVQMWTDYCMSVKANAHIDDLHSPLRLIGQNLKKGFCLLMNNRPEYLTPERRSYSVSNSSDFDSLLDEFNKNNTHNEGIFIGESALSGGIPALYDKERVKPLDSFLGYNVTLKLNF
jgi:hypothetical protein